LTSKPKEEKHAVAILTSFVYINHGYSLTGIVEDQCRMLAYRGHPVHLFVCENFPDKEVRNLFLHDPWMRDKVTLRKEIPKADLIDYRRQDDITEDHLKVVERMKNELPTALANIPIIFTHDLIFTGWHLPYAKGIQAACNSGQLNDRAFLHWVHSIPSANLDFWNLNHYQGRHKIVFPNKTDSVRVSEQFGTIPENVLTIPHIKDYRSFCEFGKDTYDFIDSYPGAMRADIIQVYPASTDRLSAKGVDKLLNIFKHFKDSKIKSCLVIANQWATGRGRREDLVKYYKRIRRAGLELDKEVIFTSDWESDWGYKNGLPRRMLRELLLLSNLFIYPTREESFGLVGPEAAMCGALMVYNKSLRMMWEVSGGAGLHCDFGSYEANLRTTVKEKDYYKQLSGMIIGRLKRNESIACKSFTRIRYNWDNIYEKYYWPTFCESALW